MTAIRLAQPADYPAITQLLADALMVPALFAPPSLWWVAVGPDSTVVGAIGVEPDGACWLLRSAVVAVPAQHNGIGKAVVGAVVSAPTVWSANLTLFESVRVELLTRASAA